MSVSARPNTRSNEPSIALQRAMAAMAGHGRERLARLPYQEGFALRVDQCEELEPDEITAWSAVMCPMDHSGVLHLGMVLPGCPDGRGGVVVYILGDAHWPGCCFETNKRALYRAPSPEAFMRIRADPLDNWVH